MNAKTLYLAAAQAAADAQGKTPDEAEAVARAAFKTTGLKAAADFAIFKQHLNYFSGVMETLATTKLPSETAQLALSEI